jgi:putative FmdB family regulatory protein
MPIYEYRCQECGASFEHLVRDGGAVPCPSCGSPQVIKQISASFLTRGERTRRPGHTCCGREERCDAPPCAETSACRRG